MKIGIPVIVTLGLSGTFVTAQDVVEIGGEGGEAPLAAVAEQVEIMRVVLTKELNRAVLGDRAHLASREYRLTNRDRGFWDSDGDEDDPSTIDYQLVLDLARGQVTSNTRGFYAPGIGAWFDTEIAVPLTSVRAASPKDDLWEESAREVRSGDESLSTTAAYHRLTVEERRGSVEVVRVRTRLDPAPIDRAIDGALEMLASYGHRLSELPRGEDIVVAMRFVPDSQRTPTVPILSQIPTISCHFARAATGADAASAETVIIRVAKRDLLGAATEGDGTTLRDRARITRY